MQGNVTECLQGLRCLIGTSQKEQFCLCIKCPTVWGQKWMSSVRVHYESFFPIQTTSKTTFGIENSFASNDSSFPLFKYPEWKIEFNWNWTRTITMSGEVLTPVQKPYVLPIMLLIKRNIFFFASILDSKRWWNMYSRWNMLHFRLPSNVFVTLDNIKTLFHSAHFKN